MYVVGLRNKIIAWNKLMFVTNPKKKRICLFPFFSLSHAVCVDVCFPFERVKKFYQFLFNCLLLPHCLLLPQFFPIFFYFLCTASWTFISVRFPHDIFMLFVLYKTKTLPFSWQQTVLWIHETSFFIFYVVFWWILIWYADGNVGKMFRHA